MNVDWQGMQWGGAALALFFGELVIGVGTDSGVPRSFPLASALLKRLTAPR